MLKKFFSVMGMIFLSLFSFYYTEFAVSLVMENDPIMLEIKKVSKTLGKDMTNATLINNNIIPGINGTKVDTKASFSKMKKYGKYNKNLLVFKEFSPSISTKDNYDKYIVSGNKNLRNVSLIFLLRDTSYLEELVKILSSKEVSATFFITNEIINNSPDVVKLLYLSNQEIELLNSDDNYHSGDIRSANNFLKAYITKKLNFCYTPSENIDIIKTCSRKKLYTIKPSIITYKYPYSEVKEKVTSGSIIALNNDEQVVNELGSIINYIRQNNYKILNLKELVKE